MRKTRRPQKIRHAELFCFPKSAKSRVVANGPFVRMISLVLSFDQEQFFVFKELNVQPVRIPTRADDPPHMLLWSADEIMPIIGGLGIGIVLDQVLICVVIGAITTNLYKRFRDLHPDGFLMHIAYHYGFGFSRSASMINPFIKNLLP